MNGIAAEGIARYDGSNWSPLGFGVMVEDRYLRLIKSATVWRNHLMLGGAFESPAFPQRHRLDPDRNGGSRSPRCPTRRGSCSGLRAPRTSGSRYSTPLGGA